MENIYRDLTPREVKNAMWLGKTRSQSEKVAYQLLPKSMKEGLERNSAVAFADSNKLYFSDLMLRKERVCIEIDGGYHEKRKKEDEDRDNLFISHGFIVIRIKNQDVNVDVAFWQRLLEGLEGFEADREEIRPFIDELRQMIDDEIRSWTIIEMNAYDS